MNAASPRPTPRKSKTRRGQRKTALPNLIEKHHADLKDLAHQNVL